MVFLNLVLFLRILLCRTLLKTSVQHSSLWGCGEGNGLVFPIGTFCKIHRSTVEKFQIPSGWHRKYLKRLQSVKYVFFFKAELLLCGLSKLLTTQMNFSFCPQSPLYSDISFPCEVEPILFTPVKPD